MVRGGGVQGMGRGGGGPGVGRGGGGPGIRWVGVAGCRWWWCLGGGWVGACGPGVGGYLYRDSRDGRDPG